MFISNDLIYIQMQKTGCTHIASLLGKIFDGEQIGKHSAATFEQLNSGRYFISSIRNPWDWYLSLWTFGVQGRGGVMHRLTKSSKNTSIWCSVYENNENIESFRKWLKMIHDPCNSIYLGEGYGETEITKLCGFMTYRHLYLCSRDIDKLRKNRLITNFDQLNQFDHENGYIDYFIRQEDLEGTFYKAIEGLRTLTEKEKKLISESERTNTSIRKFSIEDYYDNESIELIANRDKLIVEKFNYLPPNL